MAQYTKYCFYIKKNLNKLALLKKNIHLCGRNICGKNKPR